MSIINYLECEHWQGVFGCKYEFRWAANAGGRGVDNKEDVWFCQDFKQKEEADYYDDDESDYK